MKHVLPIVPIAEPELQTRIAALEAKRGPAVADLGPLNVGLGSVIELQSVIDVIAAKENEILAALRQAETIP